MWQQLVLYVPWLLFPALGDKMIALLGITANERDARLAVTEEMPITDEDVASNFDAGDVSTIRRSDAHAAFHTIWSQADERFREDITEWFECAREDPEADLPQATDVRNLIWAYFAPVTRPTMPGRLGPAKLAISQAFLLQLPWALFPPLDDDAIALYGITAAERDARLAVSELKPVSASGSVRALNLKDERKMARHVRRFNEKCPLCIVVFRGRPDGIKLPRGWKYFPKEDPYPGELEFLVIPKVESDAEAVKSALPYITNYETVIGPFQSYDQFREWHDANKQGRSTTATLGLGEVFGEDG